MAQADDRDLFQTTRGRILLLLCAGRRTVNELMDELGLTDNAVRAQLVNLQQDGLVRQVGLRPGTRKPHADYELTLEARQLFPRAHEPVLRTLIDVLREQLPEAQTRPLMMEVARRLLASWVGPLREPNPSQRTAELYQKVQALAPGIRLEDEPECHRVRACACPLASVTASHPEVCQLLADVLGEMLGTRVREACERGQSPRCCFEVNKTRET
ncbi:MAG TPA: ArsR family transcriptional regulator [Tepidisphaeraceae bacterium]|jgi:predicted ArsR family transcriptional regulator